MSRVLLLNMFTIFSTNSSLRLILFYPKLGKTCMALILPGLMAENYGRICRKKSKSPKHRRSSKELLKPHLFIAAANYAKDLLV